jgi:cellulose synthase/poly-beta-1,6-N-acetylglucosamine synthase-like glycosyltransferase
MGAEADECTIEEDFDITLPMVNGKKLGVTIGIPAYNEEGRIGPLLKQVLRQKGVILERIIFNVSGSTDGTGNEVASTADCYHASSLVKIIDNRVRSGKATALSDILKACNSGVVIFLDGDVRLHDGCLKRVLKPFLRDSSAGVVSGNVMSMNDGTGLFSFISQLERQMHHELCVDLTRRNQAPKVNGTFFAMKTDVARSLPRETVSDDEYISWCAQNKGYRVTYAPEAIVYTKDPDNYKDYLAKRRRIFAGHFLIKLTMGYTVPTTRLSQLVPRLLKHSMRNKKKLFHVAAMLLLQLAAYALAISDLAAGNIQYRYRVESAKFQQTSST